MSESVAPASSRKPFVQRITVQQGDIDLLGHANNVVYVKWVQDVAVEHSKAAGLDWEAYRAIGAIFVVRRHEIDYLLPALVGDEIELATWVESTRAATTLRRTLIRHADGRVFAKAATTWVLLDVTSGRPRRIPADLMARFHAGNAP